MEIELRLRVKNDEGEVIAETTHEQQSGDRAETIATQLMLYKGVFDAYAEIGKKKLDGTLG